MRILPRPITASIEIGPAPREVTLNRIFSLVKRELNAHGGAGNQLSVLAVIGHSV
jgi:hypothetical protein